MIKVIIADDEGLAREKIKRLLSSYPAVQIVAECADGKDAVSKTETEQPDIIFLDIKMPLLDGVSAAKKIPPGKTLIIFTTAYDKFAVEAFEIRAFDYLLKPFDKKRFDAAMSNVLAKLNSSDIPDYHVLDAMLRSFKERTEKNYLRRIIVKEGENLIPVMVSDIEYMESEGNYLNIYTKTDGKTHLHRDTLSAMEEGLNPNTFIRISRSALIRIDSVASMQPGFSGEYHITMKSGKKLKTGRTYKDKLEKLF